MKGTRTPLPSMNSLVAFESFARVGNVTRTAEELHTSQAAISRHLKQLESLLGAALVKPSGRGLVLTPEGESYVKDVSDALTLLREAGARFRERSEELVIACTHEVSHLILMPRYNALKKALGALAHIRIVTCEYDALPRFIDIGIDIVFRYAKPGKTSNSTEILSEELMPVAAPGFVERHRRKLARSPDEWHGIPRISLTKDNSGWATWEDWFASQALSAPEVATPRLDNYVYALEAAARGEGIVLAWRCFADDYLDTGRLVPVGRDWLRTPSCLHAVLTDTGTKNAMARKFVSRLSRMMRTQ